MPRRRSRILGWTQGDYYTGDHPVQTVHGQGHHGGTGGGAPVTPVTTLGPPPGSFDPALEYERMKAERGLTDLTSDTERADRLGQSALERNLEAAGRTRRRAMQDLRRGKTRGLLDLGTDETRGLEDLGAREGDIRRQFERDMFDLGLSEQRGGEDHFRAVAALNRKYGTMAEQQSEAAASGGVSATRGGFAEQSAQKRTANQAIERAPIDTSRQRQVQDIGIRRTRLGENEALALGLVGQSRSRLTSDADLARSRLGQDFSRSKFRTKKDYRIQSRDLTRQEEIAARTRAIELSRAVREQAIYDPQQIQEEYYQAHAADPNIRFPTLEDIARMQRRRGGHHGGGHN